MTSESQRYFAKLCTTFTEPCVSLNVWNNENELNMGMALAAHYLVETSPKNYVTFISFGCNQRQEYIRSLRLIRFGKDDEFLRIKLLRDYYYMFDQKIRNGIWYIFVCPGFSNRGIIDIALFYTNRTRDFNVKCVIVVCKTDMDTDVERFKNDCVRDEIVTPDYWCTENHRYWPYAFRQKVETLYTIPSRILRREIRSHIIKALAKHYAISFRYSSVHLDR